MQPTVCCGYSIAPRSCRTRHVLIAALLRMRQPRQVGMYIEASWCMTKQPQLTSILICAVCTQVVNWLTSRKGQDGSASSSSSSGNITDRGSPWFEGLRS
eukprot:365431-Chlamydomonas_euryale.AAC.28